MNPKIISFIKHYLYGLFATMWNAGWSGAAAIAGIDGASIAGASDKIHVLTAHEMAAAFLGAAVLHGVIWINQHRLPDTLDTNPPMPPPKPSSS